MFRNVIGHDLAKVYLKRALNQNTLAHAILFSGIAGIGKSLLAYELAAHLLSTTVEKIRFHNVPDFHEMKPEGKSGLYSIESVRSFIDEVYNASFGSHGKVFLFHDVDRMQPAAANAILKTLEEPALDTTIILITERVQDLLPTIRSRCVELHLSPLSQQDVENYLKGSSIDPKWASFAGGSIGRALEIAASNLGFDLIHNLLSEKKPYFQLCLDLEKLENSVHNEDPVKKNQNVEHLFAGILLWYRDQEALIVGIDRSLLFFPEIKKVDFPLPKMEKIFKLVDIAKENFQRNIKLATCLEPLFLEEKTL